MQEGQASKRLNGAQQSGDQLKPILPKFHSTISELFTSSNYSATLIEGPNSQNKLSN